MKLTRVNETYAYGDCTGPPSPTQEHVGRTTCGNTVKFTEDGSKGLCPACGLTYVAHGNEAAQQQYEECAYCGADITGDDVGLVPDVDDDTEWNRLVESHFPGCEWAETRAHCHPTFVEEQSPKIQ